MSWELTYVKCSWT